MTETAPEPTGESRTVTEVLSVPRDRFLQHYWDYGPGEHVTFLAPTQSGKTTLANQLLDYSAGPRLPAIVLVMKPRDPVAVRWAKALEYRTVRQWPPIKQPWNLSPRGYVLWPKHTYDFDRDDAEMYRQFRSAIVDSYRHGDRILFGDEVWGLCEELNLQRELIRVWTRGASMRLGLWAATQKPSHIPLHAYSQAEHLFLHNDPDKRNRDRFAEIGGVDPDLVRDTVMALPKYHFLYVRRTGGVLCVVEP